MGDSRRAPLWAYALLLRPARVSQRLDAVKDALPRVPNQWQLSLGVLRMWHRILFHSDTVGTSVVRTPRKNLRSRLLSFRPLRLPFLLGSRAIAPWDLTGLASSRERLIRHLLGAHHDGDEFQYDLEILACDPGALTELRQATIDVLAERTRDDKWLRDLAVFEGYHDALLEAVDRAMAAPLGTHLGKADDIDGSFWAFLDWCARQPKTPRDTLAAWRRGTYRVETGISPEVPKEVERFLDLSSKELADALASGHTVKADDVAGRTYDGISLGLPALADRLAWKKFRKVFDQHGGYNVAVEQNALADAWIPRKKQGREIRYGHYQTRDDEGLLLRYKTLPIRDPLVAVHPGRSDLLLGWSYLELGPLRVPTPSYFLLKQSEASAHR